MQWVKIYSGTATDPKFRLIAKDSSTSIAEALGVWLMILEKAGEADGDASGFNPRLADVAFDMADGSSARIIEAMQTTGLLDGMRVVKWQARQSSQKKQQAMSNAERQRKYREARRNETVTESNEDVTGRNVTVTERNVTRNETVTESNALKEEIKKEIKNLNTNTAPQGVAEPSPPSKSIRKKALPPDEPSYRAKSGRFLTGRRLQSFDAFWQAFDFARGKAEAADAWLNIPELTDSLVARICDAARQEASLRDQLVVRGQTPKWAQGWINARRWEDYELVKQARIIQAAPLPGVVNEEEWRKAQETRRRLQTERETARAV